MADIILISFSVFVTIVYLSMGVGVARLERRAIGKNDLSNFTILLWSCALLVYSFGV